jgi:hypothetical protein
MSQLARAIEYRENRLEVIPLYPGKKEPLIGWKNRPPLTDAEIQNYFSKDENNIGVFCGPKSDNLLVIDFDSRRAWEEYRKELSHIANKTLVTKTRRGYHIFTRTPGPILNNPYRSLKEIDVKYNGYVVAPESRIGDFQYEFFANYSIYRLEALEELPFPLKTEQDRNKIHRDTDKPYGLPWRLFNVLKGKTEGWKSRSHAEQALITYCVNQGWDIDQIVSLFTMHAISGTHFKEHKDPMQYLLISFRKAQEYLSNNKREIDRKIDDLFHLAQTHKWSSRTADYDRVVFMAFLKIAKRSGKLEVGASIREIAEMTGINSTTVKISIERIPFLHLSGRAISNVYRIGEGTNFTQSLSQDSVKDCGNLSLRNETRGNNV